MPQYSMIGEINGIRNALSTSPRTASDEMDLTEDPTPAAPAVPLIFSRLPREIRDQIYQHAYESDQEGAFKMTSLADYMRKERDRRKYGSMRRSAPVVPRETPTCPLLNMRVSKKFFVEASEQWFRQTVIECKERYVFNSICEASPIFRKLLTRYSCVWDSCYFVSDNIAEHCSAFAQLKRCKNIRSLNVEVRERTFEEFNRLACVDTFTVEDFKTMQEARDLLSLPLLGTIDMKASKCSLGVTEEEKVKWVENVAALDAYMKSELKKQKLVREQLKAKHKAKCKAIEHELAKRKAHKQKISQGPITARTPAAESSRPASLFTRARNFLGLRTGASSRSAPAKQAHRSRAHPAMPPSNSRSTARSVAEWKTSQDKIIKRAMAKREKQQSFPFMNRIDDLEDAYAGIQELFEGRSLPPQERGGLVAFYKRYPTVVISLATTTTLSIVNSIALWNVMSQR